jgi:hypothetical protein
MRPRPAAAHALMMLAGLGVLLASARAAAIPAFARKYQASCALCHGPAYPALNAIGRRFQENGYQLEPVAEAAPRARTSHRPDPDERLALLDQLPLSLRAVSSAVVAPDRRPAGSNALDLQPFEAVYLLAGAALYPNVSLLVSSTLYPTATIHHAALGFHNLLSPEGHLNLRVGRLLLLDFVRPEHRLLTAFGNPIATAPVGLNPTVLDSTQHGAEIYGRFLARRIFYHLALVQGAQGADGVRDLDGHKDLFGELQVMPWHWLTVGVLGHRGRTQITDDSRGLAVRFTDSFQTWGGMLELDTAPLNLFGQLLHVNHQDPADEGEHADYWAVRLEGRAPLSARLFLIGRYDQLTSHHLTEQRLKQATVHLGGLLLTNLRLGVESTVPLDRIAETLLTLRLEVAL